jgi:hypothetical protein
MAEPQADEPLPAVMRLQVTNRNPFRIDDMFNGVPVSFPTNVTVDVSNEIALHCFGYPGDLEDRAAHCARRFGWAGREYLIPDGSMGDAEPRYVTMTRLIAIEPVYYDLVKRQSNAPILPDTGDEAADRVQATVGGDEKGTKGGTRNRRLSASKRRSRNDRHRAVSRETAKIGAR